jgi:DNA-binding LytR/AlgR family response regulator
MFRIAICDEMQPQALELADALRALAGEIPGQEVAIDVFYGLRQLQKAMSECVYQLLFLETRIGGFSGIDFVRRLRLTDEEIDVVFCSVEADSALAAYSAYPTGYLLKPVDRKKLRDVFRHVVSKYRQKPSIVLKGIDGSEQLINVDDVLYIEVFGTELDVHCRRGVIHCTGTLVEASNLLTSQDFYRSHRSFIVNLRYAVGIERCQFRMINGDTVTVAKNRYTEVKAAYEAYAGIKVADANC